MDISAFARHASSLSNTGSPIPTGMPLITHSTLEPMESFSAIQSDKRVDAFS